MVAELDSEIKQVWAAAAKALQAAGAKIQVVLTKGFQIQSRVTYIIIPTI